MAATLKIPSIFTAVDRVSSVVKTMQKSISKFSSKSVAAFQRLDQKISKTFKKLGRFAQMGLGLGAGFLARDAINKLKNYEQAVADLAAVMNTSIENQKLLANDAKRLGAITAKSATEVVGLQEAYARLGFETSQIIDMTEATIHGSVAMNAELAETAELTGAMVKTFDDLSSIDAPDILDKMTLATQKSALNFEKLQTGLPIVSGAANAAGISFETTLALLGKLSDAGIDASSSATALRNIFLDSAKKGHSYSQILKNIEKNQNKLTAANDVFGKRGAVSATILSGKLKEVSDLTDTLSTQFKGTAEAAAETRLDTFGGSLTLLTSAYEGLLLKTNDSSGALRIFTGVIKFVTKNIETIALIIGVLVGLFVLLKTILVTATVATTAYNIALGIMGALSGRASIAIGANTIALNAYKIATSVVTAAQWLLNAAMTANPIGLIIAGVAILIGIIAIIIKKYDDWGASLTFLLGPFGIIINLIQSFRRNWDLVKKSFKEGGILAGLKSIGKVLLDAILYPMQQLLELMSKIPGKIGSFAAEGANSIRNMRNNLGVEVEPPEKLPSPEMTSNKITNENIQKNTLDIDIKDKGGNVENVNSKGDLDIPIRLTQTQGAF